MRKSSSPNVIFPLILFVLLSAFSLLSAGNDRLLFYAKLSWSFFISYIALCIYRHGNISRYRSILFILVASLFLLEFKFLPFLPFAKTAPPYCHIAQSATILNFFHSQFLALASGQWLVWGTLTLGFLWLLIMFTIGQGVCSWVCFYGGLDEACAKFRKKPLIKLRIPNSWRDFPLAFLIFLLVISFLEGLPVFCSWFCPFKLTEAFWDNHTQIRIVQIALFWLILGVFVILLPLLSKKRTFCSLICPFGALVSICGKVSPYRVIINKEKCTHCGKCQDACPVFAVESQNLNEYRISSYCNRCGSCIDLCPAEAIDISAGGNLRSIHLWRQLGWQIEIRDIFIFLCLLMSGVISGSFIPRLILQLTVHK